jgi:hypothetical protein
MSSTPLPTDAPRHHRTAIPAATIVTLLVGGMVLSTVLARMERKPDTLPKPVVMSPQPPLTIERCGECHAEQVASFKDAPHMRTLHRATDPEFLKRFAGETIHMGAGKTRFHFFERDAALWVEADAFPEPVRLDWMFGSGSHAVTPVTTLPDAQGRTELIEHHVSWYPGVGLGATLGRRDEVELGHGLFAIGRPAPHEETLGCFGCHSSHLPVENGRILEDQIVTGVHCSRCHTRVHEHVAAMDAGLEETFLDEWNHLSPLEAINRCGECHRRADQMTAVELTPENRLLLRFAPVGMSQSPCFLRQEEVQAADGSPVRFDCTFCHDPHRPASRDVDYYVQRCLTCHGEPAGMNGSVLDAQTAHDRLTTASGETPQTNRPRRAPVCRAEPMTSQCLRCHMPKVEVQPHLEFTDHWIRIRSD